MMAGWLRTLSILPLTRTHVEADDSKMKPDLPLRTAPHDSHPTAALLDLTA
jgi:hypothetical protein